MIKVGDKVKYSRNFLRSTGMFTGEIPFAKGIVTHVKDYGHGFAIATIGWQNPEVPERVNTKNLVKVGAVELV